MSDIIDVEPVDSERAQSLKTIGWVSYILHLIVAVGAVLPATQPGVALLIVALVIDLVKKSDAEGTWQASHFSWRIRTVIWAAVLYLVTLPLWLLFLLQFTNVLMLLLIFVATVAIILYFVHPAQYTNLYIGVLLFIAVIITCYETYSQEAKSDSLMEKFRAMVPAQASVIRDGVMKPTDSTMIVIGDLIRLKTGDKVPADCRIIHNLSMKVRLRFKVVSFP